MERVFGILSQQILVETPVHLIQRTLSMSISVLLIGSNTCKNKALLQVFIADLN